MKKINHYHHQRITRTVRIWNWSAIIKSQAGLRLM